MKPFSAAAPIVCCGVLAGACSSSTSPPSAPAAAPVLTVTKNGSGNGTVTSSPAGIDCGATCLQGYPSGTAVTLTATPDRSSVFFGWSGGGCSGTGTCQSVLTSATTVTATFNQNVGPYTVRQTETRGGEVLSGTVCNITTPFTVNVAAPAVAFNFRFAPTSATSGAFTYAYSIPSAGESHDASGQYTIAPPAPDGTLVLSMTGSDHVVFRGFDGNVPFSYRFSLVPGGGACPVLP